MNTLLFFYPVIILLGLFFLTKRDSEKNRNIYIYIVLTLLTAESCLRGVSVGNDTEAYYSMWVNAKSTPWSYVLTDFQSRYMQNAGTEDIGFNIYIKILQLLSENFQYYLMVSALCFFIPFGMLLKKYIHSIRQLIFVFIFYVSLFNMIAMSGVRKEIALGLAMLAFLYYTDKKYVKMIITVAIGATIHMSTLLFLIVPLLGAIRPNMLREIHIGTFFLIPVVIASSSAIIILMGETVGNEKYVEYGLEGSKGGAFTFTLLIELLSFFCYWAFRKVDLNKDVVLSKLYIMLPCFTFFAPLITNNGSMIRVSQYFHVYVLILLPYAIEYLTRNKNNSLWYMGMSVALMFLALYGNDSQYCFFWQDQYRNLFISDYSFIK